MTITFLKAIVRRKSSGKVYFVSNGVQTRQPDGNFALSHCSDSFTGCVMVDGRTKGRVFSMKAEEFDIIEIKEQKELPNIKEQ